MKYRAPKLVQTPPAVTKVDERRQREEYDRSHPWRPLVDAVVNDGTVCELQFSDLATVTARFFLAADGYWYRLDPPAKSKSGPTFVSADRWGGALRTESSPRKSERASFAAPIAIDTSPAAGPKTGGGETCCRRVDTFAKSAHEKRIVPRWRPPRGFFFSAHRLV